MRKTRHTRESDLAAILEMYDNSRREMRAEGNVTQWVGYPTEVQIEEDMARGASFVVEDNGEAVGTFALVKGEEPTYNVIERGRWIDESEYATLHRMARVGNARGVSAAAFAYAKEECPHLRMDTHQSNYTMRHIAEREGFVYCGVVYMSDGTERLAYEWWRWDEVPEGLKEYVEESILPMYDTFDKAHGRGHVQRVMARAMKMEPSAKAYAAAAMHDIGLVAGRERHHEESGRMIRGDRRLREWFDEAEVEEIAQAAEDHRASAGKAPRSRLGCIVAEADRDIEPYTIVERTVMYSLGHYPEESREWHWQRIVQHIEEKYSENGYIRLWFADSPNAEPLRELRALYADRERLKDMVEKIMDTLTHKNQAAK